MTNEPTDERSGVGTDDVTDARVSETYRDLARERTPASLNEQVLRDAAAHAGGGYSRWVAWLRPLAWAATVALCLAIVVQIQQETPEPGSLQPAMPPLAEPGRSPEAVEKNDVAPEADAAGVTGETLSQGLRDEAPEAPSADYSGPRRQIGNDVSRAAAQSQSPADTVSKEIDALRVDDAAIVEQAEEMARMREGSGARAVPVPASSSYDASRLAVAAAACDDEVRNDAKRWYDCIEALRDAGRTAAAEEELERLRKAFPEFEPD